MLRRSFLKLLPVTPFAAHKVATDEIKRLTGLTDPGLSVPTYGPPNSMGQDYAKGIAFIKTFGLPEWYNDALKRRSMGVHQLDPDIAAKCWSFNVKIQHQRERNLQRIKDGLMTEALEQEARKQIPWWPWW